MNYELSCFARLLLNPTYYVQEEDVKNLESLAISLMHRNSGSNEASIAFGYLAKCQQKLDRALYFAYQ